ncbi:hypothetical protein FRC01_014875, partial [Tulasnella sp. 417]
MLKDASSDTMSVGEWSRPPEGNVKHGTALGAQHPKPQHEASRLTCFPSPPTPQSVQPTQQLNYHQRTTSAMNSQSTRSTGQRNTAFPTSAAPQPPGISERFADAKSAILDLIENTAWTSNSSKAQQSLRQSVNGLEDIPNNTAHIPAEEMVAMEEYIGALERVRGTLGEASEKYGRKDLRKRDTLKRALGHLDRSGSAQVLEACRTEIEAAVKRFG